MSSTAQKVLKILKEANGDYVSGQKIAEKLKLTRCSVWKAVLQLKKEGNMIYSVTNRGYCLNFSPESINADDIKAQLPPEFEGINIHVENTVDSTSSVIRKLADQGAPSGTVVIAREQTNGRGRQGKTFTSERDCGIYMSLLLRPDMPADDVSFVTTLAGVAVCKGIFNGTGFLPGIKWTNDIVHEGKKIGGILTELTMDMVTGRPEYLVVGIGINTVTPPGGYDADIRDIAVSLGEVKGDNPEPNSLAASIIERFFSLYFGSEEVKFGMADKTNWQRGYIIDESRELSAILGQEVEVVTNKGTIRGTALDISAEGSLIISSDGEFKEFRYGEVHVVL